MSRLESQTRFDSVAAEAPPLAEAAPVATKKAVKLALEGDELIQFSIRPSLWFIAFAAAKWIVAAGLLCAALAIAARSASSPEALIALQLVIAAAAVRVGVAMLQWASRIYVLTNRRVMSFRGVLAVRVVACPLARIRALDAYASWAQRPLGLGSLRMTPADERGQVVAWEHVAHAAEIHEKLLRAVRKAQSGE